MSAFHCATDVRYSSFPPRVAALRRSSREMVPGSRPSARAISRTPLSCALSSVISSRSANDRYRPVGGVGSNGRMPPPWRNHRPPTDCDTPTARAASSGNKPFAISSQNATSNSRWNFGCPGDLNFGRIARSAACCRRTTQHPSDHDVLRQPVESADRTVVAVEDRASKPAMGCTFSVSGLERVLDKLNAHVVSDGPSDELV